MTISQQSFVLKIPKERKKEWTPEFLIHPDRTVKACIFRFPLSGFKSPVFPFLNKYLFLLLDHPVIFVTEP